MRNTHFLAILALSALTTLTLPLAAQNNFSQTTFTIAAPPSEGSEIVEKDTMDMFLKNFVPNCYDDEMLIDRLNCIEGGIPLIYQSNIIKPWIKVYTEKKRDKTIAIISRSTFYFPIYEKILKEYNMPEELKYLSVVESALIPTATSWAAAVGLWQFIPSTGSEYGLRQDQYIDERMDIYESTRSACRYLKNLYNMFGDWHLAMAAYNCGPGRVAWAIQAAGGKRDFWKIYNFLPAETRGYVPAFIAASYILNYYKEHNMMPEEYEQPIEATTTYVNQFLNLEAFAKQIDVPYELMLKLNPHLKKKVIPNYLQDYPLYYPAYRKIYFEENKVDILTASAQYSSRELGFTSGEDDKDILLETQCKYIHEVAENENLQLIALRYNVNIAHIRAWNRIPKEEEVQTHQKIAIWLPRKEEDLYGFAK